MGKMLYQSLGLPESALGQGESFHSSVPDVVGVLRLGVADEMNERFHHRREGSAGLGRLKARSRLECVEERINWTFSGKS